MKKPDPSRVSIVTLGCSKNQVDSEVLGARLLDMGFHVVHEDRANAQIAIINTCGFIGDAKAESVNTILEYARLRKKKKLKKLIVMGCLSERYKKELEDEIHEVDAFFGVNDQRLIPALLEDLRPGINPQSCHSPRILSTPGHYAFLKISEGCDRHCAFCAIPGIRGRHISRSIESLVEETRFLASTGVKELILIAQELTYYGLDLYKKRALATLINALSDVEGIHWIRLQYSYPHQFPDDLLEVMANNPKVCRYIDLPLQHINTRILQAMKRNIDREQTESLVAKIRKTMPDVAFRTTFIVGFPGETNEEYEELYRFVETNRFDRVGVFTYSHEEGTDAYALDDNVSEGEKQSRLERLMALQQEISLQLNQAKIGRRLEVLIDKLEGDYYVGRSQFDSPEVDNEVLISAQASLQIGHFYEAEITDADYFDLYARIVSPDCND